MDSFAEFDDLILELDSKNSAEYAMYLNESKTSLSTTCSPQVSLVLLLVCQVSSVRSKTHQTWLSSSDLGFTRGGYTFHKHDWKLLNDPTLMGVSNFVQGAMVPLMNVTDARSGVNVPALSMFYKEANGYSRELEHWVTGGGVLGHTNNGDAGTDVATFHYRSEIGLCVRAANQHVMIKG